MTKKITRKSQHRAVAGKPSDRLLAPDQSRVAAGAGETPGTELAAPGKPPATAAETLSATAAESVSAPQQRRRLHPARLADKLRRIRAYHKLTQSSMLLVINPSESENNRARVSQYEAGTRIPSLVEAYNYARFAQIPLEILLNDNLDLPSQYYDY